MADLSSRAVLLLTKTKSPVNSLLSDMLLPRTTGTAPSPEGAYLFALILDPNGPMAIDFGVSAAILAKVVRDHPDLPVTLAYTPFIVTLSEGKISLLIELKSSPMKFGSGSGVIDVPTLR